MASAGKNGKDVRPDKSLIDEVYETAIEPARLGALVEAWDRQSQNGSEVDYTKLERLGDHLDAATRVVGTVEQSRTGQLSGGGPEMFATYLLLPDGRIAALNEVGEAQFGGLIKRTLDDLPFSEESLAKVRREAQRLASAPVGSRVLVRVTSETLARESILRLTAGEGTAPRVVHVRHSEPFWPLSLDRNLQELYGVTVAEVEVIKLIAEGLSVTDIAKARGRRVLTIRAQVRALLRKLDANSHADLGRIVYSIAALSDTSVPHAAKRINSWRHLTLRDGRTLGYLTLGDPDGRPFLWLPSAMGIYRLTQSMETELAKHQLCMIVPARAGYGPSSPAPAGVAVFETAASDISELMQRLNIGPVPVVCIGQDLCVAVHLVTAYPNRVTSIIACSPVLPAFEPRHFARMNTLQRFFAANARHAPRAFNFVVRAGFGMARRLGTRRFALAAFGNCEADAALLDDPEVFSTLILGSQPVLSDKASAHAAFAAETLELNQDWSSKLFALKHPITFYAGTEDAEAPIATLREFEPHLASLTLIALQGEGRLAMFSKWSGLLELIKAAVIQRPA
jgi:pimeloyl-ACP methyl ester carboxylesterase/DNA-binding CsgD family transcriptional regulator